MTEIRSAMKNFILFVGSFLFQLLPAQLAAESRVTVILDWFVNPDHAPLIVSKEKGYFKEKGLDVVFIAPADPNDPPKLVAANKAEIAVSYQPQLYTQVNAGLPLIRIGTLISTPLNSLVVLANGPIKSISDFKGKKIGFSVGGFEDALLKAMLNKSGLYLSDVELVNVNFSLSPALISGKVDGVIGAFRNFELNQMDIVKHPGRAFFPEEEGVPAYDELILVANKHKLNNAQYRSFLDGLEKGVQFLINYPNESWKLFIGKYEALNDELNRRAWGATLPRFALRPAALDKARYVRFGKFLKKQGLIEMVLPIENYAIELPN